MRWIVSLTLLLAFAANGAAPTLTVEGDDGNVALELTAVTVRATVRGHLARTEFELTYHNSMSRQTSGKFHFPLPADAEVSDLGLWFDGRLRHAVAVERVLARQAYDETVHRAVDPALVEWSADRRAFDLEVFPIPANGDKQVFIAYDQELTSSDYELDLRYASAVKALDVKIDADGRAVINDAALYRVAREEREIAFVASSAQDNTWYASATHDITPRATAALPAPHVVIFYDTSSSSVQQNRALLTQFLSAFLAKQQAWAAADVIPFHVALDDPQRIDNIGTPNATRTLDRILGEQQPFGATNLVAVAKRIREIANGLPPASRIVLVTDGLTSLGDSRDVAATFAKLGDLHRPVLVVNAAPNGDSTLLDRAARVTGGWAIDLTSMPLDAALDTAMRTPIDVRLGDNVVPARVLSSTPMRIATAMRSTSAITSILDVPLRVLSAPAEVAMVRRAYARAMLRELLARNAPDEELIEHGRAFTQLTPRTSLLVLESWWDYDRYGIELPPELAEEKRIELERRNRPSGRAPLPPPPVVTPGGWYVTGRVTDRDGAELPGVTVILRDNGIAVSWDVSDANGRFMIAAPSAPLKPSVTAELVGFNSANRAFNDAVPAGTSVDLLLHMSAVAEAITVTAEAPVIDAVSASTSFSLRTGARTTDDLLNAIASGDTAPMSDDPEVRAAVAKQRHALTDRVVEKLRAIGSTSERVRYYLNARNMLGGDKSFHIFAAVAFRERSPEIAARILSDLAEAHPNHAALLRILARVLEGWDEHELAELLLQRAIEIAPLESQSWRELILLEARLGRTGEVAQWGRRLRARKGAETENDDVHTRTEEALERWESASYFDRKRGVDLRVARETDLATEMMFDTGYSYVDLHVTEPSGERVAWNHETSVAGATHTGGFVFGYGPQIYSIETAPRGDYVINADYYSDDESNVSLESLAHVIVTKHGKRSDYFVVMRFDDENKKVATVTMD
jgi:tetratricopeptide (TPR) repeat protein